MSTEAAQLTNFWMPLGIIEEVSQGGGILVMTRPDDGQHFTAGTPVTIWDMDGGSGALARYRGRLSEVGETVAAFIIEERQFDPSWPEDLDPLEAGNPVYLALPDSFEPDPSRLANRWELGHLQQLADEFEAKSGISTGGRGYAITAAEPNEAAGIEEQRNVE